MRDRTYQIGYSDSPGRCDNCLRCVITVRSSGRRTHKCLVDNGCVVKTGCCNNFGRGTPLMKMDRAAS